MQISICEAKDESQAEGILNLITEKSIYDGCKDELELTLEDVRRDFFGASPKARALIAYCDDQPVAIATFGLMYSTFKAKQSIWLDDLYVVDKFRAQGAGKQLIQALAQYAQENTCSRIDWIVYQDNELGLSFYNKLNAHIFDELRLGRLDADAINALVEKERKGVHHE
jgi:GNAT superfamily N-acetyltransferase